MNLLFYIKPSIFVPSEPGYEPTELWVEQDAEAMLAILPSESIWVFSRWTNGDRYFLDSRLTMGHRGRSSDGEYGKTRVYGGSDSVVFVPDGQDDLGPLLRSLSITINAEYLAKSFQGPAAVRRLTNEDHHKLLRLSRGLRIL